MKFSPNGAEVYRDYVTSGIPATGNHNPEKSAIRTYLRQVEDALSALSTAGNFQGAWDASSGSFPAGAEKGYSWVVSKPGTVSGKFFGEGDQLIALVSGASTTTYAANWVVIPAGASGVVTALDEGTGTANAVQVVTESGSGVREGVLLAFTLYRATTASPVTVSVDGGPAISVKSNTGINASALSSGQFVCGQVRLSAGELRLLNDQDVTALVAQAEAAEAGANDAADRAESAAAGVEFPVSYAPQTLTLTQQDQVRANIGVTMEVYLDRGELAAKSVPPSVNLIRLLSRAAAHSQSMGGLYKRVSTEEAAKWPSRAVAADAAGSQFLLQAEGGVVYPEQLGAYPTIVVEAETKTWYDACTVKPTYLHLMHMDRTIRRMKWRGLWPKITQFLSFGGEALEDAGINVKSPGTRNATLAGSGTFTPGVGYKGNSADAYVNLGPWASLIARDAAFFMPSFIPTGDATGYLVSSIGGSGGGVTFNPSLTGKMATRLNSASNVNPLFRTYRDMDVLVSRRSADSLQVYEAGELATSYNDPSVAVSADAGVLLRSGGGYSNETIRAFVVGNVALNADHSDAKALNWIMTEHVDGLGGVVGVGPSCGSIGFISSSTISEAQRLSGLVHAAEFAVLSGVELVLNMGVWSVSGTVPLMRSGLYTRGVSRRGTIIAAANVGFNPISPLVSPGHYKGGEADWRIDNLTIDGRAAARGVTDVGTYSRPGPSNVSTDGSRNFRLTRLDVLDPLLHGVDYSGTGLLAADGRRQYGLVGDVQSYKYGTMGANCFIDDIHLEQCGDDQVTVHASIGGIIQNIKGYYPSERHSGGWRVSYVCEVDDGGDEIVMRNIFGQGHRIVATVKSHSPFPTPRGCVFENIRADFCSTAVSVSNSTQGGQTNNHVIRGVYYTNPWIKPSSTDSEMTAMTFSASAHVSVSDLHIKARGTENYLAAAISIGSAGASAVHISNFTIENWKTNAALDNAATIRITGTTDGNALSNGKITGCGKIGIQAYGVGNDLNNLTIAGTDTAASIGVQSNSDTTYRALKISGFTTPTSGI